MYFTGNSEQWAEVASRVAISYRTGHMTGNSAFTCVFVHWDTRCECECAMHRMQAKCFQLVTLCLEAIERLSCHCCLASTVRVSLSLSVRLWLFLPLREHTGPVDTESQADTKEKQRERERELAVIAVNFLFAACPAVINGLNLVAWKSSDRSLKPLSFSVPHSLDIKCHVET